MKEVIIYKKNIQIIQKDFYNNAIKKRKINIFNYQLKLKQMRQVAQVILLQISKHKYKKQKKKQVK